MHKADFQRLLGTAPRWRSAHFAMHHVSAGPTGGSEAVAGPVQGELSTAPVATLDLVVDNSMPKHLLGVSVPKRHARRSVTRSALKRLLRSSFQRHAGLLPPGLWLVRLRSAFPTAQFRSADSSALRQAATIELDLLLGRAAAANANANASPNPSPSPSA